MDKNKFKINRKIVMGTMDDMKEFQANANTHILRIHEVLLDYHNGKISAIRALQKINKMNDNESREFVIWLTWPLMLGIRCPGEFPLGR